MQNISHGKRKIESITVTEKNQHKIYQFTSILDIPDFLAPVYEAELTFDVEKAIRLSNVRIL